MPSHLKKRPEYWKSPAVRWLLKRSSAADPETLMREEAQKLIKALGQDSPPFLPQKFARLRKIKRIEWVNPPNLAELAPTKGGFILRVRNEIGENRSLNDEESWARPFVGRENFSIAHEIGHTYFYDIDLPVPRRPLRDPGSIAEERLCDIFATELLMPRERFTNDAQQWVQELAHPTMVLLELSKVYRATIRSVTKRAYELGLSDNTTTIRWDWMLKPNEPPDSLPKLRIDWAEPSSYPYIPKYSAAPKGSLFERASLAPHMLYEQDVSVRIGGLKGNYTVEALGWGESRILSNARDNSAAAPANIIPLRPVLSIIRLDAKQQKAELSA